MVHTLVILYDHYEFSLLSENLQVHKVCPSISRITTMAELRQLEFVTSPRGTPQILLDGFLYSKSTTRQTAQPDRHNQTDSTARQTQPDRQHNQTDSTALEMRQQDLQGEVYNSRRCSQECLGPHPSSRKQGMKQHRKEGNVLFNDALNTFYLRLYGVRHMVKNHSDRERGNPLPPHRLLFSISIPRPLLHQSWGTGWNEK